MPRKRRAAKARRDLGLRIDRLEVIDWLLVGRLRESQDVDRLRSEGVEYDPFVQFDQDWPPSNLATIWRAHRAALMAEAERRGIREPWGLRFEKETS